MTSEGLDRARELLTSGDRAGARSALFAAARVALDRAPVVALLDEHFPLPDAARERLRVLGTPKKSIEARLVALARAPAGDPRAADPALGFIEALIAKGKPLAQLPAGALEGVVAPSDLVRLLRILLALRARSDAGPDSAKRRVSDELFVRGLVDRASGGREPPPALLACEVACPGCAWPALLRCRKCRALFCGFDRCATAAPPRPEATRLVCAHEGLLSPIRNDRNLDLPEAPAAQLDPGDGAPLPPGEPIALTAEWRRVGEVGVDSGRAGVVPVGGGTGVGTWTGVGDGVFPVEARRGDTAEHVELRIVFDPAARGGRWSTIGAGGSRTGYFTIDDPVVRSGGCSLSAARDACGRGRVARVADTVVIRAAAASGRARSLGGKPVEVRLRFSPTIRTGRDEDARPTPTSPASPAPPGSPT